MNAKGCLPEATLRRLGFLGLAFVFAIAFVVTLLLSERPERAASLILSLVMVGVVLGAVIRPGPRAAVICVVVFGPIGIYQGYSTPTGIAGGLLLPLIAAVGLTPYFRGAKLAAGLFALWFMSVVAAGLALTVGDLARIGDGQLFVPGAVLFGGPALAMCYGFLWWLGERRAAAIEEAREQEQRYRLLFEESVDGVVVTTPEFQILEANPAFSHMVGYSVEELRAMPYTDLLVKGDAPSAPNGTDRGGIATRERRFLRRDGSIGVAELRTRSRSDGNLQVSCRDITERRTAEEELVKTTSLLETLLETSPMPFAARLFDGTTVLWNRAAERVFGWTKDEVLGKPLPAAYVPAEEVDLAIDVDNRLGAGEVITGERIRRRTKDGQERLIDLYGSGLRNGHGEMIGLASLMVDVTDQVAAQEQRRQSAKMEAIGHLAGGVAHDFNNLLTAIRGNAELMLGGLSPERDMDRQDLTEIIKASDRASALTKGLLAFARQTVLRPRAVDPCVAVRDFAPILRRLLGESIEVEIDVEADCGYVLVDPAELDRILLNLAVNARDAMPSGGRLRIECSRLDIDEAHVARHPDARIGRYARISVADSGLGMDEATLGRMFEPFFTTKDPGKGTGMGLATVFGVVKMSDGWIDVESSPGKGTRFGLHFPATDEPPKAGGGAGHSEEEVPRGTETVLLVEDDAAVRSFGKRCLTDLGYRVLEAACGADAIEIAESRADIDLVISDVVMPGMQGPEVLEGVRRLRPNVRVMLVTAFADVGSIPGFTRWLQKPYALETLARSVRSVLDIPRQ